MTERDTQQARAGALNLHGLLAHWGDVAGEAWVSALLGWEEQERARRSLERRLRTAHIGRFKPLCDFDWTWPKRCDRVAVDALMTLEFLGDAANVVLVGPNGVGKSMLAQNIAHQALIEGHTVLFTSAGQLLGDLAALDSDAALRRRLRHYARPQLLIIDEVGYLSYSNRHGPPENPALPDSVVSAEISGPRRLTAKFNHLQKPATSCSRRVGAFSQRETVGWEQRSLPLSGKRPQASLKPGSLRRSSRSSASS
jgi:IstB-like ATP binding protein